MLSFLLLAFILPSHCLGSGALDRSGLRIAANFASRGPLTSDEQGVSFSLLQRQAKGGQKVKGDSLNAPNKVLELVGDEGFYSSGGRLNTSCRVSDVAEPKCNCFIDNIAYMRDPEPTEYEEKSMWKPSPVETVFTKARAGDRQSYMFLEDYELLPAAAFNPTLLELPRSIAASWHPKAHYLAIARHQSPGCKKARSTYNWQGNAHSSVLVMDKSMATLLIGTMPVTMEDFRLVAFKDKVLVTGNFLDGENPEEARKWSFRVFEMNLQTEGVLDRFPQCPRSAAVEMKRFKHGGVSDFDTANSLARFYGKNLGLIFPSTNHAGGKTSGIDGDDVKLVWRLTNPVDVRSWTDPTHRLISSSAESSQQGMRNNGNPIFLPEHNAYLAIGHMYWSSNDKEEPRRRYVHRLVMFNANPPHEWLRASQPFCFAAVSDLAEELQPHVRSRWCESIQFIMSWIRHGNDIVITYGINDCESATARFPVQAAIDATSTDLNLVLPHDLSDPRDGFWTGVES